MASDDLASLLAGRAATLIANGTLSSVDLLESCLARIAGRDAEIHAWVHVDEAGARAVARERDAEARAGRLRGPLHGVPVGIKDIFHVAGMTTTCGAAPAFHVAATEDATAVARLRAAGAIILGKTHTTEFAYFEPGPTRNPWNTAHTPGGSSSGSAAAVAARMTPLALGTQTVGSVLRPAAYCGVVGFKGTHGLIPTEGVVPLAWSLDHVGLFARAVADVALTAGVLAGRPLTTSAPPRPPRLALAPELVDRATPETAAEVRAVAARLARAGATVEEVKMPASFAGVHAAGRGVLEVEASAYHEELYQAHAAAYRPRTRELIAGGLARPAVAYVRAQRARLAFREEVMPLLAAHDALLSPTAPAPAPEGLATGDPWFCAPWSFAGVPACSLPSGVSALGLPHAVQLIAAAERDTELLAVAAWCERVLEFKLSP